MNNMILATLFFAIIAALAKNEHNELIREDEEIRQRLIREDMRRRNEEADRNFRIELNRAILFWWYCHWDMNRELEV